MDDHVKAAFSSAADTSKQLITLATALIGAEVTFAKDILKNYDFTTKVLIGSSWVLLLVSVVFGVWTLMALTGSLGKEEPPKAAEIFGKNICLPAICQIILFLAALLITVVFAIRGLL